MQPSTIYNNSEIHVLLKVDIMTNYWPSDTSWKVKNILTSQTVFEGNSYTNKNYLQSKTHPVFPQDCFLFTVYDSYDDGLIYGDYYGDNPGSY